jgi:Family of unknown function (DUF6338)
MPRGSENRESSLLRFLTLSAINYGLWVWLVYLMMKSSFFVDNPVRACIAWAFVVFVSPAMLGLGVGALGQRNAGRRLLDRLGISTLHPIPTAWDYFFGRRVPVWVVVTLTDGSYVAGYYGTGSFASSERDERDLYLEAVYNIQDATEWVEVPRSAGVWIRGTQIRHLEFRQTADVK